MKILFITNLFPPCHDDCSGSICANVNRAMKARGHQTLVLTSDHGVSGRERPKGETGVRRDLWLNGFMDSPHRGLMQLRCLELRNDALLRKAIRDFNPDVIHVFDLHGLSKSLVLTLQRIDRPTVYCVSDHWIARSLTADVWLDWWNQHSHGFRRRAMRKDWAAPGRRWQPDKAAPVEPPQTFTFRRIYFASGFLRDKAIESGCKVAHGEVIYNSVDTIQFDGQAAPRERPLRRLLYAGELAEDKGVMTLLRAMSLVRERFAGELTLCGSGEPAFEAELRAFVAEWKLPVHFQNPTHEEMPAIYRSHDVLIFPSERQEPFALSPLEAMACGLPVIATTSGGSAEFFRDRGNALTFPAGDQHALAQRILWLEGVPSLRRAIALAGQSDVRAQFAEEVIIPRIEAYIQETVLLWSRSSPARRRLQPATAVSSC